VVSGDASMRGRGGWGGLCPTISVVTGHTTAHRGPQGSLQFGNTQEDTQMWAHQACSALLQYLPAVVTFDTVNIQI
jgi:hypothetical protein